MDRLIRSEEHRAWWGPNHRGYTNQIAQAGRYSEDEARRIIENANYGSAFHEIAIPVPEGLDELIAKAKRRG